MKNNKNKSSNALGKTLVLYYIPEDHDDLEIPNGFL